MIPDLGKDFETMKALLDINVIPLETFIGAEAAVNNPAFTVEEIDQRIVNIINKNLNLIDTPSNLPLKSLPPNSTKVFEQKSAKSENRVYRLYHKILGKALSKLPLKFRPPNSTKDFEQKRAKSENRVYRRYHEILGKGFFYNDQDSIKKNWEACQFDKYEQYRIISIFVDFIGESYIEQQEELLDRQKKINSINKKITLCKNKIRSLGNSSAYHKKEINNLNYIRSEYEKEIIEKNEEIETEINDIGWKIKNEKNNSINSELLTQCNNFIQKKLCNNKDYGIKIAQYEQSILYHQDEIKYWDNEYKIYKKNDRNYKKENIEAISLADINPTTKQEEQIKNSEIEMEYLQDEIDSHKNWCSNRMKIIKNHFQKYQSYLKKEKNSVGYFEYYIKSKMPYLYTVLKQNKFWEDYDRINQEQGENKKSLAAPIQSLERQNSQNIIDIADAQTLGNRFYLTNQIKIFVNKWKIAFFIVCILIAIAMILFVLYAPSFSWLKMISGTLLLSLANGFILFALLGFLFISIKYMHHQHDLKKRKTWQNTIFFLGLLFIVVGLMEKLLIFSWFNSMVLIGAGIAVCAFPYIWIFLLPTLLGKKNNKPDVKVGADDNKDNNVNRGEKNITLFLNEKFYWFTKDRFVITIWLTTVLISIGIILFLNLVSFNLPSLVKLIITGICSAMGSISLMIMIARMHTGYSKKQFLWGRLGIVIGSVVIVLCISNIVLQYNYFPLLLTIKLVSASLALLLVSIPKYFKRPIEVYKLNQNLEFKNEENNLLANFMKTKEQNPNQKLISPTNYTSQLTTNDNNNIQSLLENHILPNNINVEAIDNNDSSLTT